MLTKSKWSRHFAGTSPYFCGLKKRITMNKFLISAAIISLVAFTSCGEQAAETEGTSNETTTENNLTPENVEAITSIKFDEESFDFGSITQGEKVEHTFKFTNTGENDLVIVSAKGSCGCTIPKWPKEPIAPGGQGDIFVVFNSEGKSNKQHKQVSIIANTEPATTVVSITGDVIAPDSKPTNAEGAAK